MTRMTLSLFAASRATGKTGRHAADLPDASHVAAADHIERRMGLTPVELAALDASSTPRAMSSPA
jgi:hypothetical protein